MRSSQTMRGGAGLAVILLAASIVPGCHRHPSLGIPLRATPRFEAEHRLYTKLDGHKSLALAGERQAQFVLGYSYGMQNTAAASRAALHDCDERRRQRRIEAPCRIIAIDDEPMEPPR